MQDETFCEIEKSNITPLEQMYSKEFVCGLYKVGSLISMLEGKKINTTALFSLLIENISYQNFFVEATASENFRQAILSLLFLYPNLVKSKITKSVIRKLNAKHSHRSGKIVVQQTLGCFKKSKKQTV
jgi:hypothetical protein